MRVRFTGHMGIQRSWFARLTLTDLVATIKAIAERPFLDSCFDAWLTDHL